MPYLLFPFSIFQFLSSSSSSSSSSIVQTEKDPQLRIISYIDMRNCFLFLFYPLVFSFVSYSYEFPRHSSAYDFSISDQKTGKMEDGDSLIQNGPYIVLVPSRTSRVDPLNNFKMYTHGWNISNPHYWASVGFTAAPFFLVAFIWFVIFGIICLFYFLSGIHSTGHSHTAYSLSFMFLCVCLVATVIGCFVLYTSEEMFHRSTVRTLSYVVSQAETTAIKLRNVSSNLNTVKDLNLFNLSLPSSLEKDLDGIGTRIDSSGNNLADETVGNSEKILNVLDFVRTALVLTAFVMLLLACFGSLLAFCGFQPLVYMAVLVGWIFVTLTFILCGTFLLLHNVAADTCVAMDQWVQNPAAHTALDDILPCADMVTANETLIWSKQATHDIVDLLNSIITNVTNINFAYPFPYYYNQSGPPMPILCNPFYNDLTLRNCTSGEVELNYATQVYSNFVCQEAAPGSNRCGTEGRLTPTYYEQMEGIMNAGVSLYGDGPFLGEVENCDFVRQTFTKIEEDECRGMRLYSKHIYIGLGIVSVAVMFSVILWLIHPLHSNNQQCLHHN